MYETSFGLPIESVGLAGFEAPRGARSVSRFKIHDTKSGIGAAKPIVETRGTKFSLSFRRKITKCPRGLNPASPSVLKLLQVRVSSR